MGSAQLLNIDKVDMKIVCKIPYVKPIAVKVTQMTFPIDILQSDGKKTVCKQCSSCHACR